MSFPPGASRWRLKKGCKKEPNESPNHRLGGLTRKSRMATRGSLATTLFLFFNSEATIFSGLSEQA